MKTLLKILLGLGIVIVLIAGSAFYFTAALPKVAEEFFLTISEGNYEAAQEYLTADFRSTTPPTALKEYLQLNALEDYQEANWGERTINNGVGRLNGTVTTRSGGTIPLDIGLVKTPNGWKIQSIQKRVAGARTTSTEAQLPNEAEALALVKDTMTVFARSVQDAQMLEFYNYLSITWRNQTSAEEIANIFHQHRQLVDFEKLLAVAPQFTAAPSLNENHWLQIDGFYPSPSVRLHFTQKYIKEGLSWKLIGFSFSLKEVNEGELTTQ